MDEKKDIKSYTREELVEEVKLLGGKAYVAAQVFDWLHKKRVYDFESMTNLSKALREKLEDGYYIADNRIVKRLVSEIDGTRKYLFALRDGNIIESVLMRYSYGNSVCVSSQVGCRMGCRFCASTLDGLTRNLTASEILDQIYSIESDIGERVSHVVIMGSGEPLDNYDNVVRFYELLTNDDGINISARNLTISTCGIVPRMYELAKLKAGFTLAVSLHAPNDEIRKSMMPIANAYKIEDVIEACRNYVKETGRRVSFEYSLVRGVNDSEANARELISRIKGINCHVNLIPVNPIKERDYQQSVAKSIEKFKNILEKNGINVTIRREMGRDINGACGQLRKDYVHSGDT